jgi:hypothetical protein
MLAPFPARSLNQIPPDLGILSDSIMSGNALEIAQAIDWLRRWHRVKSNKWKSAVEIRVAESEMRRILAY